VALSHVVDNSGSLQNVYSVACIRRGVCLRVCPHDLSPVLIKEAFERRDRAALFRLQVGLCEGCGDCRFACPSRIDLVGAVLRAKASMR
jgi:electron transport complex protein RnfC